MYFVPFINQFTSSWDKCYSYKKKKMDFCSS